MLTIIQIGFFLGAFCAIFEEAAFTWPFRELSETVFTQNKKEELSKIFHRFGWAEVLFFGLTPAASAFYFYSSRWGQVSHFISWALAAGLVYMTVFNVGYSLKIGKGPFYLGNSATEDKFLNKTFGKFAGAATVVISLILLFVINYFN